MMKFDEKYYKKFNFTSDEIKAYLKNAIKDFNIAQKDKILDVKFNYAYNALIKLGIALLSYYHMKVKSVPGHHIKIIDSLASFTKDDTIIDMGELMRKKRNLDLYAGGIEVTEKECQEYIGFVEKVLEKVKKIIR